MTERRAMNDGKSLPKRKLGSSGIEVSAIGLGCMSLSGIYGKSGDDDGIALIHEALDQGITLLDSSDAYGAGHNEELVGKALKGRRSGVVLATKFGNLGGRDGKFADGRPEFVIECLREESQAARRRCDRSLLSASHRSDRADRGYGRRHGKIVQQGKVRALGISEASPATIRRAHATHPLAAVQNEFSLIYRADAEETLAVTRKLNIAFVAYSPLGRGLLTGGVAAERLAETDARRRHPRFSGDNLNTNISLAQRLGAMAKPKNCTTGQLVLAWLLAQGDDIMPIPGTKQKARLLENIGALVSSSAPRSLRRCRTRFRSAQRLACAIRSRR